MISRAAVVSRICWSCRVALAKQHRAVLPTLPAYSHDRFRRSYASNPVIQSKERIEALISGESDDFDARGKPRARSRGRRSRGNKKKESESEEALDDTLDWDFAKNEAKSPIRDNSTSTTLNDGTEASSVDVETLQQDDITTEDEPFKMETTCEANPSKTASSTLELPDFTRQRTFRHDLLHHHSLGVEALGRPIDALIIKNPNKMRSTKKPVPILEEEPSSPVHLEWESFVQEEEDTSPEPPQDVWNNIEELRPADTTVLRRRDFDKLVNALVDGFTRDQLRGYFEEGDWHDDIPEQAAAHSWIVKQGEWSAAQPNDWSDLKPKQYQATLILMAKWKLEIQEHIEGLGRTPIWLRSDAFQLIARPSSSILESLKLDFLDGSNSERITSNAAESRLSIYTRKGTAPVIISRINEILQSLTSRSISVHEIGQDLLLPSVLEELGRITDTSIHHNEDNAQLDISWLARKRQFAPVTSEEHDGTPSQIQTEDPADVVLRLLLKQPSEVAASEVQIITPSKPSKAKKGTYVNSSREKRSMSWRDKLRGWSRYVSPNGQSSDQVCNELDLSKRVSLPASTHLVCDTRNDIAATFGHVLYDIADTQGASKTTGHRIFSPVVPHPASLTSATTENENPVAQRTAIILNFAPVSVHENDTDIIPHIRLRLPVNPDDDLSNFALPAESTLEGLFAANVTDLSLPTECVDVRITQQAVVPLDVHQPSLRQFMANSQFNLLEGRLLTPPRASFLVPRQSSSSISSSRTSEIPYIFMGLQIHQTVDLEWRGNTLRYNSIEAGQHGGQRQELSIVAGLPSEVGKPLNKEQMSAFLDLAGEVAAGTHFSWQEGYKLMQERSDEEFNMDLMEQEAEDEDAVEEPEDPNSSSDVDAANTPQDSSDITSVAAPLSIDSEINSPLDTSHESPTQPLIKANNDDPIHKDTEAQVSDSSLQATEATTESDWTSHRK